MENSSGGIGGFAFPGSPSIFSASHPSVVFRMALPNLGRISEIYPFTV